MAAHAHAHEHTHRHGHDGEIKPIWTSSSFLVYTGGLTVLIGALSAFAYLATRYGSFAQAAWALLMLVVLYGVAHALQRRGRAVAAGIFAFASVIAWAAFVILVFRWWGWNGVNGLLSRNIHQFSISRLVAELLIIATAWDDRRRFRFPFIRVISATVGAFFVIDLITAGSTFAAAVALIVGLVYLVLGNAMERPSAFWLHLVGGVLILGSVIYLWHTGDGDFAIVSIVSALFVLVAYWTARSSWAVLGAIGFFAATGHYVSGSATGLLGGFLGVGSGQVCTASTTSAQVCTSTGPTGPWAPALAYGLLGFFLVGLGMLGRRHRHKHVAVEVTVTAPPPAE